MTNLLKETLETLAQYNKSAEDVKCVLVRAYGTLATLGTCSFAKFADLAKDIEYDAGYGGEEINSGLVILGNEWWLSRWEYDGSEGWKFNTIPVIDSTVELTRDMLFFSYGD
jgi:hypothetical protein